MITITHIYNKLHIIQMSRVSDFTFKVYSILFYVKYSNWVLEKNNTSPYVYTIVVAMLHVQCVLLYIYNNIHRLYRRIY